LEIRERKLKIADMENSMLKSRGGGATSAGSSLTLAAAAPTSAGVNPGIAFGGAPRGGYQSSVGQPGLRPGMGGFR